MYVCMCVCMCVYVCMYVCRRVGGRSVVGALVIGDWYARCFE